MDDCVQNPEMRMNSSLKFNNSILERKFKMENNETERTMVLEEMILHIQEMTILELIEFYDSVDKRRKELQEMMD